MTSSDAPRARARGGGGRHGRDRRGARAWAATLACALACACAFGAPVAAAQPRAARDATIANVTHESTGASVRMRVDTRGVAYDVTWTRSSALADTAEVAAGIDGGSSGAGARRAISNARVDALRKCSYDGTAAYVNASSGVTTSVRAFGTLCDGQLRLVVETTDDDLLTVHGDVSPDAVAVTRERVAHEGGMVGVEDIANIASESMGQSWFLSDELDEVHKGVTDEAIVHPDIMRMNVVNESATSSESNGGRKLLQTTPNYVELVIWGSKERMQAFEYDVEAFIEETILQVSVMQAAYDKTGFDPPVKIVIKQILFTPSTSTTDPWGYVSSNAIGSMLETSSKWILTNPAVLTGLRWDAFMVITKRDLSYFGPIGMAYSGGICTRTGVSANAITKGFILDGATTMAHEFGHNLGFTHDGNAQDDTGSCSGGDSVMAPVNGAQEKFSQCSINSYNTKTFRAAGVLYRVDHSCLGEPGTFCGNGVREVGEDCDCYNNDCTNDPGCNGATCKFAAGKMCSVIHDKCCDGGTGPKVANTVCRAAADPCDVEEKCDGTSVSCPPDIAKPTGEKCDFEGDVGSCYGGTCSNRDINCKAQGPYVGGKWSSLACAATLQPWGDFSTFNEDSCNQPLWCATKNYTCEVQFDLYYWNTLTTKRNGFPCSTVNPTTNVFPKVCYESVCTSTAELIQGFPAPPPPAPRSQPPFTTLPRSPPPSSPPPPSPPPPRTAPAPPNNVAPGPTNDPQDQPVDPPTTTLDGDDVSNDNGIVNYVTMSIKVSGYAPSEFNVANRKAFALGLALYLDVSSGADGVSLLGVDASQRRRLLSSSSLVHVKVLLTTQDSPVAVLAAMDKTDPSKVAALQTVMKTVLPKVEQMEVTTATISTNSDVGVYVPPNNEVQDVKEFGGGLIATAIFVVFFTPFIAITVGVVAGPDSRVGQIIMVFIGEEKYAKLRAACCGARAAEPTAPQKHARKRMFFV